MMGETLSEQISERPAYRVIAAGRFGMKRGGIRGEEIPQLMTLAAKSGTAAPLVPPPMGTQAQQALSALTTGSVAS